MSSPDFHPSESDEAVFGPRPAGPAETRRRHARERAERNAEITVAHLRGETLESLAKKHGVTRERIRQIHAKQVRKAWEGASSELRERAKQAGGLFLLTVQRELCEEIVGLIEALEP